jgi:hypothetical protein
VKASQRCLQPMFSITSWTFDTVVHSLWTSRGVVVHVVLLDYEVSGLRSLWRDGPTHWFPDAQSPGCRMRNQPLVCTCVNGFKTDMMDPLVLDGSSKALQLMQRIC